MTLNLRAYQTLALNGLRAGFAAGKRSQILYLPTGGGKCLGIDTPIVMSDGSLKMVQDVAIGDKLLGPDGRARNVSSLARGREMLYRVKQVKGDDYVVNESHILSLKVSGPEKINLGAVPKLVNISVGDYIGLNKTAIHRLKGWRPEAFEFDDVEQQELPLDAYWLGLWLGDGRSVSPSITKPMCNAVQWWIGHARAHDCRVSIYYYEGKCPEWYVKSNGIKNPFMEKLRGLNLIDNKHIPKNYKLASIEDRLKLIAGLLDTDGHLNHNGYDWLSKYKEMAQDFAFICKSVGLSANVKECRKGIKSIGFEGAYWLVNVSGDTNKIPCLDKIAKPRLQVKRSLVHGISVSPIGVGDYYGFEIDGDKLFLLGDFTVTHNTEVAIALLEATKAKGNKAAMVLDRIILCDQTSQRLQKYSIDHGVLQSGHWRYRPYEPIQVCSAQTIEKRGSFPGLTILIIDECHSVRKQTNDFIKANPEIKVVGLSATPFTKGLGNVYETVVSTVTTAELVKDKVLVPLRVFIAKEIDMTGAKKVAGEWSQGEATKRGMQITGDIVAEWIKKTHEIFGKPEKTVVFCSGVEHGADLAKQFAAQGYNFISISYKDDADFKREVIADFEKPDTEIIGLIACDILTKGFDCVLEGSMVLTDNGLVRIEEVTIDAKIWDGHEFVSHGGAIYKGVRNVITYAGLTATSDHLVKTKEGWIPFGRCADEQISIVSTGNGGKAIQEHEGYFSGNQKKIGQTEGRVWDILNAGPRNSFTCQGLLIHNCPGVKIGVSARPFSKSLSSHIQQMGRVMRSAPEKSFGVWLDHAGNYLRFQEDWDQIYNEGVQTLDDGKEKAKKEKNEGEKEAAKCPKCGAMWPSQSDTCLHCGHTRQRKNKVDSVPGEMEELTASKTREEKQEWWSMCQYKVNYNGWSSGRALASYRDKFGVWPKGLADAPKAPDIAFEKAVKAALIRYMKGKK